MQHAEAESIGMSEPEPADVGAGDIRSIVVLSFGYAERRGYT